MTVLHRSRDTMPGLRPILVTPPSGFPVTLDEVKKHCRVDHSDDDDLLQAYIEVAVTHLDGWSGILGRCMLTQTWKFSARCWPGCMLIPLPDVSNVAVSYQDGSDSTQSLSADNYRTVEVVNGTLVEWTASFASPALFGGRTDVVSFAVTAGYGATADAVPRALRVAIMMLVSSWYQNREAASVDGGQKLPFAVDQLIAGFRRNTV